MAMANKFIKTKFDYTRKLKMSFACHKLILYSAALARVQQTVCLYIIRTRNEVNTTLSCDQYASGPKKYTLTHSTDEKLN